MSVERDISLYYAIEEHQFKTIYHLILFFIFFLLAFAKLLTYTLQIEIDKK